VRNINLAHVIYLYVILQLVYPLVSRIRARWIWSRGRRYFIHGKLDPVKIAWIIREKERHELTSRVIAERMGVSEVWVKKLWRRYRVNGCTIPEPRRPGRKPVEISSEERDSIVRAYARYEACALVLERIIHIPHNRIHRVLREMGLAMDEPKKHVRKKWIRYERKYSNSLWHADWTLIDGMGWLIAYLDDASRFVLSYGLFPEATSEHSVEVLKRAIANHGKPASILTDRGIQFYANEAEEREKGATVFERYLVANEIRQVLSRVSHPQTNGKVERFFGTVKRKLPRFDDDIDRLMVWYNTVRPHMSLNLDEIETPQQAYIRKMPNNGLAVDEESGEIYHARKE
jgi:putative transposase